MLNRAAVRHAVSSPSTLTSRSFLASVGTNFRAAKSTVQYSPRPPSTAPISRLYHCQESSWILLLLLTGHKHTRLDTHNHCDTHTNTHTHTHVRANTHTCVRAHTHSHAHTYTRDTHRHAHTHAHTHSHTYTNA